MDISWFIGGNVIDNIYRVINDSFVYGGEEAEIDWNIHSLLIV